MAAAQHSPNPVSPATSTELSSRSRPQLSTRQTLPQTSSSTRRNFNLHIDLPRYASRSHETSTDSHPEHQPRLTLFEDDMGSTGDGRKRGPTSPRVAQNVTGESREGLPMTPQERVLRARLERVLSLNAISPPPMVQQRQNAYSVYRCMEDSRGTEKRSRSASRGYPLRGEHSTVAVEASGGLWGWFWRDHDDDSEESEDGPENTDENHNQSMPPPLLPSASPSPLYLPTPQSAGPTSPKSEFFDRPSLSPASSGSRQGRIRSPTQTQSHRTFSPAPGRPRSQTQPKPPTSPSIKPMESPRMLSKAMESLSNHQRRSASVTRSPSTKGKTPSDPSYQSRRMRSPTRPEVPKLELGQSISGRRTTANSVSPDSRTCPSGTEVLLTPPPTPPTEHSPSRIPVAVSRRGKSNEGSPVMERERERNHRRAMTAQVAEVAPGSALPSPTEERERNHRRTLSVQATRQPVRNEELLRSPAMDVPGTPHRYGKTFLQETPRSPRHFSHAPDPTQFLVVNNPAAPQHTLSAPSSPKSSRFDIQSASVQCRAQEGYVSFAAVDGLGEPEASENEDAAQQQERKRRWLIF
ncbi:hypothetical protein V5O48_015649 [Marasmius crinis-equi]|uniref:Uncharacterized protein n=1 Tax=Marasmius crinis-equi TaxID=585013 RepID=A0ABR3ETX4_9AGAR